MTYTTEQTEKFFAKKVFEELEAAQHKGVVDAAMMGIARGIANFKLKCESISPETMKCMLNVYDTEDKFRERQRMVRFTQHHSTGKGNVLFDATQVVLKENLGVVMVELQGDRVYPIAETLEEAQKIINAVLTKEIKND